MENFFPLLFNDSYNDLIILPFSRVYNVMKQCTYVLRLLVSKPGEKYKGRLQTSPRRVIISTWSIDMRWKPFFKIGASRRVSNKEIKNQSLLPETGFSITFFIYPINDSRHYHASRFIFDSRGTLYRVNFAYFKSTVFIYPCRSKTFMSKNFARFSTHIIIRVHRVGRVYLNVSSRF